MEDNLMSSLNKGGRQTSGSLDIDNLNLEQLGGYGFPSLVCLVMSSSANSANQSIQLRPFGSQLVVVNQGL